MGEIGRKAAESNWRNAGMRISKFVDHSPNFPLTAPGEPCIFTRLPDDTGGRKAEEALREREKAKVRRS